MVVTRESLPRRAAWRIIDIAGAVLLLALSFPLLALAALAVLLGAGRPVFFGHRRLGRDGRPFRCWKLRTMRVGAEQVLDRQPKLKERYVANGFKLPNGHDPRVTPVGRWLRRTYLDEIPQLFNVLGGSMSLVGHRPIIREELALFGSDADELLRHKPGLFGEWTSRGRRRPDYPERARIELEFVRNRTFVRELYILVRSVPVVLKGQEDA